MPTCPSCGAEVKPEDSFCLMCGSQLIKEPISELPKTAPTPEDEVKDALFRRLNALGNRDEKALLEAFDRSLYTRFDDWPPPNRQESDAAIKNELGGVKVLANYAYEVKDLKVQVIGEVALVTFHLHYRGRLRNRSFDIQSRVSTVFRKEGLRWMIVHEHYSRFPEF